MEYSGLIGGWNSGVGLLTPFIVFDYLKGYFFRVMMTLMMMRLEHTDLTDQARYASVMGFISFSSEVAHIHRRINFPGIS